MTLCKLKLKKKQRYISLCMMFVSIHHQWLQVWFAGAFFCIDMGNIVFIHMIKIHLPNMYMIFECHTVENKYVALFYNTPKLSTFRIISDSLKLFAPNSLGPFQLLHFLLFFLTLVAEHLESFAPLLESCMKFPHLFCSTDSNGCKAQPKLFGAFKRSILIPSSFSNPLPMHSSIGLKSQRQQTSCTYAVNVFSSYV